MTAEQQTIPPRPIIRLDRLDIVREVVVVAGVDVDEANVVPTVDDGGDNALAVVGDDSIIVHMGNIIIGYVKYNPTHKAHLTNVADQWDVIFNVIGASVAIPNAQYPAEPNTTINILITVNVEINK
mmetsp:Transcript_25338/g.25666  ORF Transcript_25338/g.25666 Transcript_25338/m.25666 type:complete len:126 (-) Transcript_25338:636-1013(-)